MTYSINPSTLFASAEKEISRFAATAYSEDGASLYDAYKVLDRDKATIEGYINEAVDAICVRLFDVATKSTDSITFDVPDYDPSMGETITRELDKYVVMKACAFWLEDKGAPEYTRFEKRALAALDNAHLMIKSRKAPKRSNT